MKTSHATRERSVEDVLARLEEERRQRDDIISRQSVYCRKSKRVMNPAQCHDCFSALSYVERLNRWNEDRTRCMAEHAEFVEIKNPNQDPHAKPVPQDAPSEPAKRRRRKAPSGERLRDEMQEQYSIEAYLNLGLLEFLLELDSLAERFENWCGGLADAARARISTSEELQEMILWFAGRLNEFQRSLACIARKPEERRNKR